MAGAAASPPPPPRPRGAFLPLIIGFAMLWALGQPSIRDPIGHGTGVVVDPVIGFGGNYPVLTVLIAGGILVIASTIVRHFTTDWLETAKTQAAMRHFSTELRKARKENNTYKIKVLTDLQPDMMARSQKLQMAQFKTMPITALIAMPLFAWLAFWLPGRDYTWFAAPWNPSVDFFTSNGILFGSSLLPHWVLLYICLSIPLGSFVQKLMKFLAWKERWQKRHPEVHE